METTPQLAGAIRHEFAPNSTGLFASLSMEQYQAAPGLSKSRSDTLAVSPLDYLREITGVKKREKTEAMELGTIYHSAIFENRAQYHVRPNTYGADGKKWSGNATECKAWVIAHSDLPILTEYEEAEVRANVEYVRKHPLASLILAKPAVAELSMFARWEGAGYMLKGRADWIWQDAETGDVCVADLKTTQDASSRVFSRDILNRRYHVQAAMYRYILQRLGFETVRFYFIALEKGSAPKCNVRQLTAQAMDEGERRLFEALELYQQCRIAGKWPEFHDSQDSINFIDLPDFVYGDVDTLGGMTAATEVTA
jgi:ATP-dependent exoDNAse (exonuclease V) beta subunit